MADVRRSASNNVYTVLVFIASLVLLFGVIYVFLRYGSVFGGMPFTAEAGAMLDSVRTTLALA